MWYAASLLFESVHNGRPVPDALWEEKLILLEAKTEDEARRKAETFGKAEEHEYTAAEGDQVRWVFRHVERTYSIEAKALQNGTELFSRFLRSAEVKSLLSPLKSDIRKSVAS